MRKSSTHSTKSLYKDLTKYLLQLVLYTLISLADSFQLGSLQHGQTSEETRLFTPAAKQVIKLEINDWEQARLIWEGHADLRNEQREP